jgi:hydroxymethylglutaryl-CoA lyase
MSDGIDVIISEVGPRDGLQNAVGRMPTEAKKQWITALAAAGFSEIEVGSFVSPKAVPSMSDTDEIVRHAVQIPGLRVVALVPNLKGAHFAADAGAHALTMPVSIAPGHSRANVNMEPEEMVEQVRRICDFRDSLPKDQRFDVEASMSTAFGCTIDGAVPVDNVVRIAAMVAEAGADMVNLADGVGYANPAQIKQVCTAVRNDIGDRLSAIHLHDTRGLALANAFAAYECGIRTFDSALAGLGGCPFSPGASGNVATEDVVFMFEAMGLRTGIDIDAMIACRTFLSDNLPDDKLHGHLPLAGVPKGFLAA